MVMKIQIDDESHEHYTLSVLLLDEAIKILIKNGELDKDKLADAITQAKDDLFTLNKDNNDNMLKMRLFMIAHTLQCRYLELT